MGVFANNAITDNGRILLADVMAGAVFTPTRIVIGSGSLPSGATPQSMTDVITAVKSLDINKKKRTPDGKIILGGVYTNEDIAEAFYFRELALYAKAVYLNADGTVKSDGDEVLYCYGNAGATADLMPAYSTSTVVEKQIDLVTWVGNTAAVNLTIDSGLFISTTEKGQAYGVAELDEAGNVLVNEYGSVGANSNMTVLAHRLEKGGLSRYISVSKENDLERSIFLTEELEGGGAESHSILHTGMTGIPEMIGAVSSHNVIQETDLLAWADKQTISGSFLVSPAITTVNVPTNSWFIGYLDIVAGGKRITMTDLNAYRNWFNVTRENVFSGWREFANVIMTQEMKFENFGEYYTLRKGRTLSNGKTHFLTMGIGFGGSATLEHYTCDTQEFDSTKLDGRLELMPVTIDGQPNHSALVLKDDINSTQTYRIYGEHFSPAVVATAELTE